MAAGRGQRGLKGRKVEPPRSPPSNAAERRCLRNWRKAKAHETGDVGVILRDLLNILAEQPRTPEELEALLKDVPWRLEHFGRILTVLRRGQQGAGLERGRGSGTG
jgi:hypothetical protein